MEDIVLAGGSGTRLSPATLAISKQLLPINDKSMIYYPLGVLLLSNIREILIISTPEDLPRLRRLLGDGSRLGLSLSYAEPPAPNGLTEAFIIGRESVGTDSVVLVLGDSISYGAGLRDLCSGAAHATSGACVFAYQVEDPQRYGHRRAGKLEITDINRVYLERESLDVTRLGRGFAWLDTGTHETLHDATSSVRTIERRQGLKVMCLEEIALAQGFMTSEEVLRRADELGKTEHAAYLLRRVPELEDE